MTHYAQYYARNHTVMITDTHSTKMNETSVNLAETRPNKQIQEVTIAIKCIGTWNVQLGEI